MEIWRISIDFGLVILIWMTQLIVYPSFAYFTNERLDRWHSRYTMMITLIVAPLMFAQVGIIGWQLFSEPSVSHIISSALVAMVWINTFFYAVPLHENISKKHNVKWSSLKLVRVNWYRTAIWSLIWVIDIFNLIY